MFKIKDVTFHATKTQILLVMTTTDWIADFVLNLIIRFQEEEKKGLHKLVG